MTWPARLRRHGRQQAQGDAQRAEIIELHHPFEIVQAVVAFLDRAADRAAGVVDQHIDAAMLGQQQLDEAHAVGGVGQVGPVGGDVAAARLDLRARRRQLRFVAAADQGDGAGFGQPVRGGQADAGRAAGDQHHLAGHARAQAALDMQRRVEVALPVVPDRRGVLFQRRAGDAAAGERRGGRAVVEAGRPVHQLQDALGQAEILHQRLVQPAHRLQRADRVAQPCGQQADQGGVDAQAHWRRMGGAGEQVEHLADPMRRRIGQVEALAVEAGPVRDEGERIDDVIDRHDIDPPALDADGRHPRRQQAADALDQLEKIIRTVRLVRFAGVRVAHDQAGTIHAPRHGAALAHHFFAFVLGGEIGMPQLFGLVEHVFAKGAIVHAGGSDRADVVEASGAEGGGQVHRVARCRRRWPRPAARRRRAGRRWRPGGRSGRPCRPAPRARRPTRRAAAAAGRRTPVWRAPRPRPRRPAPRPACRRWPRAPGTRPRCRATASSLRTRRLPMKPVAPVTK